MGGSRGVPPPPIPPHPQWCRVVNRSPGAQSASRCRCAGHVYPDSKTVLVVVLYRGVPEAPDRSEYRHTAVGHPTATGLGLSNAGIGCAGGLGDRPGADTGFPLCHCRSPTPPTPRAHANSCVIPGQWPGILQSGTCAALFPNGSQFPCRTPEACVSEARGGATTTGPDVTPPPAICQNLGGGGVGLGWTLPT